jgi:glutamate---cysteine ligase / carboxylate-amine ligase
MGSEGPDAGWEVNFGCEAPFAIGVEEELLLVDRDNQLAESSAKARRRADPDQGDISPELYSAMVETRSEVSRNAGEAIEHLTEVRRELCATGSRFMGTGIHPAAEAGEASFDGAPRYEAIRDTLQGILRTPICGQHIHVGVPDRETAVRAYNGIRVHIPLLNALAANSPFWFGEDSGLASARTVVFRSYPRAAMAPAFDDFDHFVEVTRQVCRAAGLDDYTHIWWDARVHPSLGTIEIRAADTQTDLDRAAGIAALVHCLTRIEADRAQDGLPAREALAESSFQATRHGLDAVLLDRGCERVPARELAKRVLEEASNVAGELGCEAELSHIETILEEGTGADLQRRVHAEKGMDGLLEWLVDSSLARTGGSRREAQPAHSDSAPAQS